MNSRFILMKNNRGFSLVELIVTVMVMSLVAGMIAIFISTSRTSYEYADTAATLQTESDVAVRYVQNVALHARDMGKITITSGGTSCDVLWFLGPDSNSTYNSTKEYYYFIIHDATTGVLRCQKEEYNESAPLNMAEDQSAHLSSVIGNPYKLLAEHATGFSWSREFGTEQGSLLTITLNFRYRGKDYATTTKIAARNM